MQKRICFWNHGQKELFKQRDSIRKELDAIQREISLNVICFCSGQNEWKEALYANGMVRIRNFFWIKNS